ncbi:MAG TPA: class E sortase [Solirubrobacteraceae bacterium]|nr:class E sortase [Solirubrobacteraceae bacterium]
MTETSLTGHTPLAGSPAGAASAGTGAPRAPRAPRRRSWVRWLSVLLIVAGVLAVLDAGVTLVWQEPLSALYAKLQQQRLSSALSTIERAQPTLVERERLARLPSERTRIAFLARELERRAGDGSPVGRIRIPHIGANFVVVNGTSPSDLKSGPGVYSRASFPQARFPGVPGTTAIAAHRTTYLAPFRHIDALRRGDRIVLEMPYARFTYTVQRHRVVSPSNVHAAVGAAGYSRLVLSACTPLFSAAQRLLVFARLTRTVALRT